MDPPEEGSDDTGYIVENLTETSLRPEMSRILKMHLIKVCVLLE